MSSSAMPLAGSCRFARFGGLAALVAVLLWGCGGVGTGGTGDYAESNVNGFGSVIVGDVEFDDAAATVLDDDGNAVSRSGNELRLGMTLEVGGEGAVAPGGSARANSLRIATLVVGRVDAVDVPGRTVTVLGQQLDVRDWTAFGPPLRGGLSSLRTGDVVAAYGYADALGARSLATRIENAPGAQAYRLRGVVSALDTAAQTLRIGSQTLSYAGAANAPANLANGQLVRVRIAVTHGANANGVPVIEAFGSAPSRPRDADSALVDGLVTAASSATAFSVNGMHVDASQATLQPAGASVAPGSFVSVQGRIQADTLVATSVQVLGPAAIDAKLFHVSGTVSSLDAAGKAFVVRNVEVDYSAASFVNGSAASLALGQGVRVEGPLSADGSQLRATQVTLR